MANGRQLTEDGGGVNREDGALDLARIREARGFTLHDINAATKITLANLEAIERGEFRRLPEPVYARNFIKSYAEFIGVDALPILSRYSDYLQEANKPAAASASPPEGKTETTGKETSVRAGGPRFRRAVLMLIGLIVLGIAASFLLSAWDDRAVPPAKDQERADGVASPPPVQPAVVTPPDSLPAASPTAPPAAGQAIAPGPPAPPGAAPADMPLPRVSTGADPNLAGRSATSPPGVPAAVRAAPETPTGAATAPQRLRITATERTWLRIASDGGKAEE